MNAESSRFSLLTWHFFRRFLDNDLISPNGDAHVGLSQTLAAFFAPGLLVVVTVIFKYAMLWRPTLQQVIDQSVSDALFYVSLSMIVLGMAATITWDAFFLEARDHYILSVLPIPGRLLTAAKLGALGLFLAVFTVAANLIPTLIVPAVMLQAVGSASFIRHFVPLTLAQALAPCLAGAWTVLTVVALRGLLALALPARVFQRVSALAQGVLVLAFLGWTISLSPFLDASHASIAQGGPMRDYSPPMWFLGLYQAILGNPHPAFAPLARTALVASLAGLLLVTAVFFVPGQRRSQLNATSCAAFASRSFLSRLRARASRFFTRHPLERASLSFTLATLGRSAAHRLYLAGALGTGLAFAMTGLVWEYARSGRAGLTAASATTLQVQQILVFFLIAAIRFGALVPAALPANWLFRVTEARPVARYFAGARRAALLVGLLPVAALLPASLALWGWHAAINHTLVGVLYTAFLVELFFNGLAKVPFTAMYVSGRLKLKSRIGYYLVGALVLTAAPSALEALALRGGIDEFTLPLWLLAFTVALAIARWRKERALRGLVFDDTNDEAIQTLGLSQ